MDDGHNAMTVAHWPLASGAKNKGLFRKGLNHYVFKNPLLSVFKGHSYEVKGVNMTYLTSWPKEPIQTLACIASLIVKTLAIGSTHTFHTFVDIFVTVSSIKTLIKFINIGFLKQVDIRVEKK